MSKILDLIKKGRIFEIDPKTLNSQYMTKEEMLEIFKYFDAFLEYDGNPDPKKTHAILKSKMHSGFFGCKKVLQYVHVCKLFSYEMFKHISEDLIEYDIAEIDVVVSSAYSALTLGHEVAKRISKVNPRVEYISVEKESDNQYVINGRIDPSKNVLIINELMTTGNGNTWETKMAVLNCNGEGNPSPNIIEPVFVLIHQSKDWNLLDGTKIVPVFHFDVED